jgi:hypothetical protein
LTENRCEADKPFCTQKLNGKVIDVEREMGKKDQRNRRCGLKRRFYTYACHIPERRMGGDRRNSQDGKPELPDQSISDSGK